MSETSGRSLLVYCGASVGHNELYREIAVELAKFLSKNDITLVYGGGSIGLMGVLADTMLENNGKVIGVIPEFLNVKEVGHEGLTQMHVVQSMHQRKALMEELCDAALALPGGYGTMDEFFEMLTWSQLGLHKKPLGILNVNGYYDHFLKQLDVMQKEGFLNDKNRQMVHSSADHYTLVKKLLSL